MVLHSLKEKKEEQPNIKKEKSEQIKPINNIADKIKMMSGTGQENLKKEEKLKSKDEQKDKPKNNKPQKTNLIKKIKKNETKIILNLILVK